MAPPAEEAALSPGRSFAVVSALLGACASPPPGVLSTARELAPETSPARLPQPTDGVPLGLLVSENRILRRDGTVFRGRGVNLHDTRSCNACVTLPPDVAGLNRWSDELVDEWHVSFVRFLLSAWASADGYRLQHRRLVDDAGYARDVHAAVTHLTDKGVYVLVSVFADPSMLPDGKHPESEWPTAQTLPVYGLLAELFAGDPRVLFGLTNEPHGPRARNGDLARRYLAAIDVIRAVEAARGAEPHLIVVSAPQDYARDVSYFVDHPLPRPQIAYEIHPYSHASELDRLVSGPSRVLPLIVGEYGPTKDMNERDVEALWMLCDRLGIPHTAWNFHARCPPNLLADSAADGCGFARPSTTPLPRSAWGNQVFTYLRGASGR